MCTAVARVYTTTAPKHSVWTYRHTGAVCVVRDSARHSYFLRLFCLRRAELVWQEEIYINFVITRTKKWLLTFEGRNNMVALSFVEPLEAKMFFKITIMSINRVNRRNQKQLSRGQMVLPGDIKPPVARKPASTIGGRSRRLKITKVNLHKF